MTGTWRDVLVLAEGAPSKPALEVLGKARDLGDRLGARVVASWPGSEAEAPRLVHHGADEVALLPPAPVPAHAAAVAGFAQRRRFEAVLAPATLAGQELAARVAARLGVPVLGRCSDLDLDEAERALVGVRATHGGALLERVRVPRARPQVATLLPGAARAAWPDDSRAGRVEHLAAPSARPDVEVLPASAEAARGWRGAERLAVGGALLDAQGFDALRRVADALGAAWAATRLAVALGLAPPERALRPWDAFPPPALCVAAGIEDPFEFALALPAPRQLVVVGDGALARVATHVLPGPPGASVRALADALAP